ncbi:UNVERIFIED_CONTAM: hypothetical protein FKN15_011143, partial [Acipenser sinensis]
DEHPFFYPVEQLPTITEQSPTSQVAFPFDENVPIKCEGKGNPHPEFKWTKDGQPFDPSDDPRVTMVENTGTFIIGNNGNISEFQGVYRCSATNKLGRAISEEIKIIIPSLQHIEQDERVSVGLNGDLYFSNVLEKDSRRDYCCFAAFPRIRTIVQKTPMTLIVNRNMPVSIDNQIVRRNVNKNDSAVYQCEASNKHGTILASANILVMNMPVSIDNQIVRRNVKKNDSAVYQCEASNKHGTILASANILVMNATQIVEPPENIKVLRGSTAQFTCGAKYDSAFANDFQVSWNKDNEEITFIHTDNSRGFSVLKFRFYVEDGVLQIMNVSAEDQGNYTCVANTSLDQAQETAELIVLEFIVEYEESRWKPGDWHELVRVPGNHTSALLKLHGHVDYQFRVSAVNEIGRSQPSDPSDRYKTLPTAPENNPGGIIMEGNLPNEIHIKWEPLKPIEQNGPGLEYKVSWRRKGAEDNWNEEVVKRHSFFIRNTPTFEPYEIQIQAINHLGFGPEPKVVTGFSGEDFPESAPQNVTVEIMNSTVIKVNWLRVPQESIRGHLGGYRIQGQAVPEHPALLRVASFSKDSITLLWVPPLEQNGILTGHMLQYQLINDTEELGNLHNITISDLTVTRWKVGGLETSSKYKFYMSACTRVGCGKPITEEGITTMEGGKGNWKISEAVNISQNFHIIEGLDPGSEYTIRLMTKNWVDNTSIFEDVVETRGKAYAGIYDGISTQGWFIGVMCAVALLTLIMLIACFVQRNKGGKYSVKEKEDLHPDLESPGINDDTFCEYR